MLYRAVERCGARFLGGGVLYRRRQCLFPRCAWWRLRIRGIGAAAMRAVIMLVAAAGMGCAQPPARSVTAPGTTSPGETAHTGPAGSAPTKGELPGVSALHAGCGERCSTTYSTPELVRALIQRQANVRSCYNRALRDDPHLTGKIAIELQIAEDGQPCDARVVVNELGDAGVAECAVRVIMGASYPPTAGGCVVANMPWRFVPKSAVTDAGTVPP
jgi:hypothetical protein